MIGWSSGGLPLEVMVERRPFLAPEAVIFGVIYTDPHILDVNQNSEVTAEVDGI